MMQVRKAGERGHFDHGWLDTRHTFSFADYYDPDFMGFRALRVINEDRVQPGMGFGTHPHRDMEIITYVLEGALEHKDSLGNGSVIRPGDVQRMTAGTGVTHSEYNPSAAERVHFLQIWILPERGGLPPSYEQKRIDLDASGPELALVAAPGGAGGGVTVHQDVRLYAGRIQPGQPVRHAIAPGRYAWLQVAGGRVSANGLPMESGDGAALSGEPELTLTAETLAEVLVFDLA
jgi:hypothetical protein